MLLFERKPHARSKIVHAFIYALLLTVWGAWKAAVPATAVGENVWMLVQNSKANGSEVCWIAPDALRIDNKSVGYSVIADGKNHTITFFSDKKKLRCKLPLAKFHYEQARLLTTLFTPDPGDLQWRKAKVLTVGKLKANVFESQTMDTVFGGNKSAGGYLAGPKKQVLVHLLVYVSSDIPVQKEISRAFCQLHGVAVFDGIPLRQESIFSDTKKVRVVLDTSQARQVPDDAGRWLIPSTYRDIATPGAITALDGSGVEDLLGN